MSSENEDSIKEQYGVKKRVSIVWKYFEKLNRFRVRCKLCRHEQNYQGTTGNILRHLKNKHDIDATLKGQSDNPDVFHVADTITVKTTTDDLVKKSGEDEDEFDVIVKTEDNEVNIVTVPRQRRETRSKVISYCEEPDGDPYAEGSVIFADYLNLQTVQKKEEELAKSADVNIEHQQSGDGVVKSEKRKGTILEERLIAEIDYFREKAAYYRMQKNLTSLQAKKIRYELDQMG